MTLFYDLLEFPRSLLVLWALVLCFVNMAGIVFSFAVKRYRFALLFLISLTVPYLFWQAGVNLRRFGISSVTASVSIKIGGIPWLLWFVILTVLSFLCLHMMRSISKYMGTYITPISIKKCADNMNCGICYWRDNGHVIFSNDCMNHLCASLTGQPLMNGNNFSAAVADQMVHNAGETWKFSRRDVEVEGEILHEMIATDVTEIYEKTAKLRKDNEELSAVNEQLKAYSLKIEDIIRREEILRAKVNIHDEMNRLMLSTVAADIDNTQEINHIFALWQKNALLLCMETDEKKNMDAMDRLFSLADALGINIIWDEKLPDFLSNEQRELFFEAAHEEITNASKHAHAENVKITFEENASSVICSFRNDGEIPEGEICFTGGLLNLKIMAEEQNTLVHAEKNDDFKLVLIFSKNT